MWSTLNGLFGCIFDVGSVNFFCVSRVFHIAPGPIPTTQYDRLSDTFINILSKLHILVTAPICRYQSLPDIVSWLNEMHHEYRVVSKQLDRLKRKIAAVSEVVGITPDAEVHDDLKVTLLENTQFIDGQPSNSFQRIFWQQQVEAASQNNAGTMRWHLLMIRWCLYRRHR